MKIRLSEVRAIVRSVIAEASRVPQQKAVGGDWTLTDPDGIEYKGDRTRVRQALIRSSNMTGDERNDTMNTGHASAAAISALKRAGVIVRASPPAPRAKPKYDALANNWDKSRARARAKAEREYHKAVKEFSKTWEDTEPDIVPEDAASDAALSFFHTYPQWREWMHALGMNRSGMQGAITDYVYDAMMKGRKK